MKTWNLGNTTVRNPERIKAALQLVKEHLDGKVFDRTAQRDFFEVLLSAGVIEGNPPDESNRAASGRKWVSVCNKLGLVQRSTPGANATITVSPAGNALLSSEAIENDIYLRQMLKVQLPSPTEDELEGAAIHPFYLVLSVAVGLVDNGLQPLTKEEIALHLQSATRDDMTPQIIEAIKHYREQRDQITGRVQKRQFFLEQLTHKVAELWGDVTEQHKKTLVDYSDTTVRYSAITGIFTTGRQSMVIKEDQLNLARALVTAGSPTLLENEEFTRVFTDPTLPTLPTDNNDFLERDIATLTNRLNQLSQETGATLESRPDITGADILRLKRRRQDLEAELIKQKEVQFYRAQGNSDQVADIIGLFDSIDKREIIGGSDYLPAWAEWGVWRVFLSINTITNPISETRGFKINTELYPIHHAKGGAEDLRFEYSDNTLIPAEITLNRGDRQYAAEREPVRNHVLKVIEQNPEKHVVGVFVAPVIQPRTAHDFYSVYRAGDYSQRLGKAVPLDILPLTINQLCQFLPGQAKGCNNYGELRGRINELLSFREHCSDGSQWLASIDQYFTGSTAASSL